MLAIFVLAVLDYISLFLLFHDSIFILNLELYRFTSPPVCLSPASHVNRTALNVTPKFTIWTRDLFPLFARYLLFIPVILSQFVPRP